MLEKEKICWANTENFDQADFVIVGVPDESQSHSLREGTAEAPFRIREISKLRDSYERSGKISPGYPFSYSLQHKVIDYGNINRVQINEVFDKIVSNSKIPITIGGDHSITREIIKAISKNLGEISLVYFDAHPDFVSSTTNYYGSVFFDVLPNIDVNTSIQIGIRTPEKEELDNIRPARSTSMSR